MMKKVFSSEKKMAALNQAQERFTLATDDTIEELRNGAISTPAKVRRFG